MLRERQETCVRIWMHASWYFRRATATTSTHTLVFDVVANLPGSSCLQSVRLPLCRCVSVSMSCGSYPSICSLRLSLCQSFDLSFNLSLCLRACLSRSAHGFVCVFILLFPSAYVSICLSAFAFVSRSRCGVAALCPFICAPVSRCVYDDAWLRLHRSISVVFVDHTCAQVCLLGVSLPSYVGLRFARPASQSGRPPSVTEASLRSPCI